MTFWYMHVKSCIRAACKFERVVYIKYMPIAGRIESLIKNSGILTIEDFRMRIYGPRNQSLEHKIYNAQKFV